MNRRSDPNLIEVLRETLENVERTSRVRPHDSSLSQPGRIVSRRVADLERTMASEFVDGVCDRGPAESEVFDWEIAS